MAYTNSVGIMPGAATEKLPFVHSDFKPRSKFAKCFGGFKKFHKNDNGIESGDNEGQKLPFIHYSVTNQRNLISMGTKYRNRRPEYPGFAGKKKLLKKKDNSGPHPAISGSFTRNQSNAMKQYLSLPNLNILHQQSETGTFYNNNLHSERKQRHRPKDIGETEFMDYLHRLQQQQHQQNNNNNNNTINDNMDSLFIVDDDDEDLTQPQHSTMIIGNVVKFRDPPASTNQNESPHLCSPHSNNSYSNNSFPAEYDELLNPFAKEVDKKLRDARGKSGMKRDRRRDPDHMRILGDVVTAERMHELLLPRKTEGPLNFADNV